MSGSTLRQEAFPASSLEVDKLGMDHNEVIYNAWFKCDANAWSFCVADDEEVQTEEHLDIYNRIFLVNEEDGYHWIRCEKLVDTRGMMTFSHVIKVKKGHYMIRVQEF
jgi:hypothetical protein